MKVLVTAALISLFSLGVALAQPGPGAGGRMKFTDELNLTDQQKKKARVDLLQLTRAEKPDQSAIEKKMKEIATLRSASQSHRLNTWFSINKLLNADQQKVWKNPLERRMEMPGRMGMRGRMQGHMQGRMQGRGMQRMFDRSE